MNSFEILTKEFEALEPTQKVEAVKLKKRCQNLKATLGEVANYPWDDLIAKIDKLLKGGRGIIDGLAFIDDSPFFTGTPIDRLQVVAATGDTEQSFFSKALGQDTLLPKSQLPRQVLDGLNEGSNTQGNQDGYKQ